MKIIGSVHCLFEQSGHFKHVFNELGIKAFDYDILNEFNETDCVVDLFKEIDKAFVGGESIFDTFKSDDLVIAFYPCIYFSGIQSMYYQCTQKQQSKTYAR